MKISNKVCFCRFISAPPGLWILSNPAFLSIRIKDSLHAPGLDSLPWIFGRISRVTLPSCTKPQYWDHLIDLWPHWNALSGNESSPASISTCLFVNDRSPMARFSTMEIDSCSNMLRTSGILEPNHRRADLHKFCVCFPE